MTKMTLLAALGLLALVPAAANAEDAAAAAPAVAEATAPAVDAAAAVVEAKEVALKDGTKVVIEGDVVSSVNAEGVKTTVADGEYEAEDGSKITVKEGKLVVDPAAPAAPEAPAAE